MKRFIAIVCFWMFVFVSANTQAQDVTLNGPACNGTDVNTSWTVPCNVTSITVEVYGSGGGAGGGGGGSNGGLNPTRGGGGGGGGGYASITISVTPGSSFSYTMVEAGCGGSNGSDFSHGGDGVSGGSSTFTGTDAGGTPVNLVANGGTRGTGGRYTGANGNGGAGGTASGGTTNLTGTSGSNGSGGSGGNGGAGAGPSGGSGGVGNGNPGGTYGGGGAGGGDSPGGAGAAGGIVITYITTIPLPATPTISSTPPTCTTPGSSTVSNYDPAANYNFTPTGPTVGTGGAISGMVTGTSYTVTAGTGSCASAPSVSFSNAVATAPPATPVVSTTPASCSSDGSSTITNYNLSLTYTFTPAGPSAGAGGVITGMVTGTSYTVESSDGTCSSGQSASFSNAAQLPVPTASISGSLSYCTGSNTTLTASGGTGYFWTDGGGTNIGNTTNVTVTQGTYTVLVSNASGCTATASATVTELTTLPVSISGALNYCPGANTTITASGGIGYIWNDPANSTTPSITVTAGTYAVTAADANGCTGTALATVTEFPATTVNISGALSYCAGLNTTITASGADSYVWNDAGNSTTPSITVTQGSYTVTGTDVSSCSATASVAVTENALPNVTITGSLTYCTGGSTLLTANGGTTYMWDNGATTPAITVTQGTYNVTATDANGCTGNASATVTESANLSVSISGVLTYCPGSTTTLTATGGSSYSWGNGSTSDNISVTQGTYSVTASDAGCTGTASALVTEIPVTALNLGNDIAACEDSAIIIDAGSGYTSYSWSNGATTQTITPQTSGSYSVVVVDVNNCSVSGSVDVAFNTCEEMNIFIPNAFSPDGDGNNDVFQYYLTGVVTADIKVFNRLGEKVFETNNVNSYWDGTHKGVRCNNGVYLYLIRVLGATGTAKSYKGSVTLLK